MAYDACALDADPKVGLPSSSLLYRVDGWREREIDEQGGAPALTYIVNCTYTTRIAQMGRTGRVCAKKGPLSERRAVAARRDTLVYGVGRTTMKFQDSGGAARLEAQRRECEGQIVSHAGRALELALHIIYARGADRIIGRGYPGMSQEERTRDFEYGHSLTALYQRIVAEVAKPRLEDAKTGPTHVNDFSQVRHSGISSESRTDEPPPTGICSRREIGTNTARLCYAA